VRPEERLEALKAINKLLTGSSSGLAMLAQLATTQSAQLATTQPAQPATSQPATYRPAQPATTQPAQPATIQSAQPATTQPAQPETTQPAQPVTTHLDQPDSSRLAQTTNKANMMEQLFYSATVKKNFHVNVRLRRYRRTEQLLTATSHPSYGHFIFTLTHCFC
jgi:FtsZ-interacting cell division protein ZipA